MTNKWFIQIRVLSCTFQKSDSRLESTLIDPPFTAY